MDGIATTLFDAVCPDCGGSAFLTEHGDRWETADLWFAPAGIQCSFGTFGPCAVRPMLVRCLGCGREGVDADLDRGAERTVPDGLERCAICGELRGSADGPLSTVEGASRAWRPWRSTRNASCAAPKGPGPFGKVVPSQKGLAPLAPRPTKGSGCPPYASPGTVFVVEGLAEPRETPSRLTVGIAGVAPRGISSDHGGTPARCDVGSVAYNPWRRRVIGTRADIGAMLRGEAGTRVAPGGDRASPR